MRLKSLSILAMGVCGFAITAWAANTSTPGTYFVETKCPAGSYCPGDGAKYLCPENSNCGASATQISCADGFTLTNNQCVLAKCTANYGAKTPTACGENLPICDTNTGKCVNEFAQFVNGSSEYSFKCQSAKSNYKLAYSKSNRTITYWTAENSTKKTISYDQFMSWNDACVNTSAFSQFRSAVTSDYKKCSQAEQWTQEIRILPLEIKSAYARAEEGYYKAEKINSSLTHGTYPVFKEIQAQYQKAKDYFSRLAVAQTQAEKSIALCQAPELLYTIREAVLYSQHRIDSLLQDNKVVCEANFIPNNLQCEPCPAGMTSEAGSTECVLEKCTGNAHTAGKNPCQDDLPYCDNGTCTKCPDNGLFEPNYQKCRSQCATNEEFDYTAFKCVVKSCTPGQYLQDNKCTTCKAGSYCPGDGKSYVCPDGANCPTATVCPGDLVSWKVGGCYDVISYPPKNGCPAYDIQKSKKCTCPDGYSQNRPTCRGEIETTPLNPSVGPVESNLCYKCTDTKCTGNAHTAGKNPCQDDLPYCDNGTCTKCPDNGLFEPNYQKCRSQCATNEEFDYTAFKCVVKSCTPGQYLQDNKCTTCKAGSYCPDGLQAVTCPTGTTSEAGAKSKDECVISCPDAEKMKSQLKTSYSKITSEYSQLQSLCQKFMADPVLLNTRPTILPICTRGKQEMPKVEAEYQASLKRIETNCQYTALTDNMYNYLKQVRQLISGVTSCPTTKYLKNGTTCTTCPSYATCDGVNFSCKVGYYNNGTKCVACPTGTTSKQGSKSKDECVTITSCPTKQFLLNGTTCTNCPSYATCDGVNFNCKVGYYNNKTKCLACPSGAESCTSATDFVCKDGYYKYGKTCRRMPTCSTKQYLYSTVNTTGTLYSCKTCPSGATCDGKNVTCPKNTTLKNGKCEVNNYKA